ncbi:MAG: acetyl-CoA carboxylase biotin carboxyl carrier protein subunit [Ignavibacteria bacterium]|nr:acetyl-CoA carboxylase biotin carboxyl carrier protein subunit [Ignavibacteria bacterium]
MNEFVITVNNKKKTVRVNDNGTVELEGKTIPASITKVSPHSLVLRFGDNVYEAATSRINNGEIGFLIDGWYFDTTVRTQLQETAYELQKNKGKTVHHTEVKAPMPGLLIKIKKKIGDHVELGEPILILEAMKMENDLRSPSSGIVKEINFKEGQSVEKGASILVIE